MYSPRGVPAGMPPHPRYAPPIQLPLMPGAGPYPQSHQAYHGYPAGGLGTPPLSPIHDLTSPRNYSGASVLAGYRGLDGLPPNIPGKMIHIPPSSPSRDRFGNPLQAAVSGRAMGRRTSAARHNNLNLAALAKATPTDQKRTSFSTFE